MVKVNVLNSNVAVIAMVEPMPIKILLSSLHLGCLSNLSFTLLRNFSVSKKMNAKETLNCETLARWQEEFGQSKVINHDAILKWLNTLGTEDESIKPA